MLFYQPICLLLIAVTLALFLACQGPKVRQGVIIATSIAFYAYAGILHLILLLAVITINYHAGKALAGGKAGRRLLTAVIVLDLANLFAFKYVAFAAELLGLHALVVLPGHWLDIALPLGISFYTFQIIAYQVDVWTGRTRPAGSLPEFAAFVMFFPQLVAGPIMRGRELLDQLRTLPTPTREDVRAGAFRFALGYAKKVVIVNAFLGPEVDGLIARLDSLSASEAWALVFLFGFQIYFDFSGYCDMALGIARAMGIRLRENFRTPYLARSPAEFWNRWNITLSHWIRDYVYIPLGGSHRSMARNLANVLIAMALCGLWHGANYGFVIWGVYHGILIIGGRVLAKVSLVAEGNGGIYWTRSLAGWFLTFILVQFGWIFFRVPDPGQLTDLLAVMFGLSGTAITGPASVLLAAVPLLLLLHVIEEFGLRQSDAINGTWHRVPAPVRGGVYAVTVIVVAPLVLSETADPFIYFRF